MIKVTRGLDQVRISQSKYKTRNVSVGRRQTTPVTLCPVKCYACLSLHHTQKICPLRFCKLCEVYSHTAKECLNAAPPIMKAHTESWRDAESFKDKTPTFKRFTHLSQKKRQSSFFKNGYDYAQSRSSGERHPHSWFSFNARESSDARTATFRRTLSSVLASEVDRNPWSVVKSPRFDPKPRTKQKTKKLDILPRAAIPTAILTELQLRDTPAKARSPHMFRTETKIRELE
jgi:hypothetical protein